MSSLARSVGSFMFGVDQQMTVIANYIQAALMLKYTDSPGPLNHLHPFPSSQG